MGKKILVVTSSEEPNVKRVVDFLPSERVFRLDTDVVLNHRFSFRLGTGKYDWSFTIGRETIGCDEVETIWYRRPANPRASVSLPETHRLFAENEMQRFLKALWSTMSRNKVFWVNDPTVLRELEFNKPYQAQVALRAGLSVPETIITNDADVAKTFYDWWNGEIIVKTFGGYPLEDEEGCPLSVFTNRVTWDKLASFGSEITYAPVMLQNYVPKDVELRITAVGEKLFCCAIHSQDSERTRDDWRRYDFGNVKHEVYQLPQEVETKLRLFLRETGLAFGAIDMIVTPDGEYVFLEVNPSGQWGWIERLTEMPISAALAELLANPPTLL